MTTKTQRTVGELVRTALGTGTITAIHGSGRNVVLTVTFDPPVEWACGCGLPHLIENYLVGSDAVTNPDWE